MSGFRPNRPGHGRRWNGCPDKRRAGSRSRAGVWIRKRPCGPEFRALAGTALTLSGLGPGIRASPHRPTGGSGQAWTGAGHGANSQTGAGEIEQIWAHPTDGRVALAVTRGQAGLGARVLRTVNGGAYWDDLTANLAPGAITGIAVDRRTGAVYAAIGRGVFWTFADLLAPSPAAGWMAVEGVLPAGMVNGVTLDAVGAQLLASVDGHGVYARRRRTWQRGPRSSTPPISANGKPHRARY